MPTHPAPPPSTTRHILVASYGTHITTLSFDPTATPAATSLAVVAALDVGPKPGWLAPHPRDASVVFTANEQRDGLVKALRYDLHTGRGEVLAAAPSGGADPCHLAVSSSHAGADAEDYLFTANYSSGSVGILPLARGPPYLPAAPAQVLGFAGTGPVVARQEASHAHQVLVHPARGEVLVPDLGADRLWRLQREGTGWHVGGHVATPPGGGPRHAIILGETLYTVLELTNMLVAHALPVLPALPIALHGAPTLLDPPMDPTTMDPPPLVAEILSPPVSAAYPTPYIYVANRNDPSPEGDVLSIFEVGPGGSFALVKEVRTGLSHVRGAAFDEEGRYLVVGGMFGGGVKMFERVDGGRGLREVACLKGIEKPTGFHWLPVHHPDPSDVPQWSKSI